MDNCIAHKMANTKKSKKVFILMEREEWLLTLANAGLSRRGLKYRGRMDIQPMILHTVRADGSLCPDMIRLEIDLKDWETQKQRNGI